MRGVLGPPFPDRRGEVDEILDLGFRKVQDFADVLKFHWSGGRFSSFPSGYDALLGDPFMFEVR